MDISLMMRSFTALSEATIATSQGAVAPRAEPGPQLHNFRSSGARSRGLALRRAR